MAITGEHQPNSPQISKDSTGNIVYIRRFAYDRDYAWQAEMPTIGSFDATYGYFRGYTSQYGPAYVIVELTYDSEGTVVNFSPSDGDTEYWAETSGEEKPVEYHANYRVKWNYGLYGKNDGKAARTTGDYPPGGGAAGTAAYNAETTLNTLAGIDELKWFKEDPGLSYYLIAKPTKAFDFYIAPQRSVFRRDYSRQQSTAEGLLATVGSLSTPAETFGATGGSWLVMSSNTVFDGRYWVTETQYLHSENGWDTDIY